MTAREWVTTNPYDASLPASPPSTYLAPCCAKHSRGFRCGRLAGHTGRHAAYGTQRVCAVWSES